MIECPECKGSIELRSGHCMDCGFDLAEYCNEYDAWLESLPPVESYQEAA